MVAKSSLSGIPWLMLALLLPAAAWSQSNAAQIGVLHTAVQEALVVCHTHFTCGRGLLVRDRQTVLFALDSPLDAGRPVHCRLDREGVQEVEAQVLLYRDVMPPVAVLHLNQELDGEPLELVSADLRPFVGDRAWTIRYLGLDATEYEVFETLVTTSSTSRLSVADGGLPLTPGAPVMDEGGRIAGLVISRRGDAVPVARLLDGTLLEPRGFPVLPLVGLQLSYLYHSDERDRFALDFELGAILWDQLTLALRIGVAFGDQQRWIMPPSGMRGWGVVEMTDPIVMLGFEPRYRLLLRESDGLTTYIDFLVGVQWDILIHNPEGLAYYSGDPQCNPASESCGVIVLPAPDSQYDHRVGPTVGLSLRWGGTVLSYRYIPGALSYEMPDHTHRFSLGFSIF